MPKPFLVDRRDRSRVYFYTADFARNPFLEESDEPPVSMEDNPTAVAKAEYIASRLMVDAKALEKARDGNALMLQSNTGQGDAKVKQDIDKRAARRKQLNATSPSEASDGLVGTLPPPDFVLPEATLPQ